MLAGSLTTFSKSMEQIQNSVKTEMKDLSSLMQLHVDNLCGAIKSISQEGTGIDQPNRLREVELIIEIMTSYSGIVQNRPKFKHSKLLMAMACSIT